MAGPPVPAVRNDNRLLSPNPPVAMSTASTRHRSPSVSPSVRSSRSRITVVEEDPEVASHHETKSQEMVDTYKIRTIEEPKYTWFDHLRSVFLLNRKRKAPIVNEELVKPESKENDEMYDESPWVLPVYVLSSRVDTSKHNLPKMARCTIDTGNQQGNLVSRDFVENVLEYSESNFCKLTEEEGRGGKGVTGHVLNPDGAIYLTWYHKKSTRVFRNMRFLISPTQSYDLVIGARSIQKDNILDVPNLMATNNSRTLDNVTLEDDERKFFSGPVRKLDEEIGTLKSMKTKAKNNTKVAEIKKNIADREQKLLVAKIDLKIFDAEKHPDGEEKEKELAELRKERRALPGYVEPLEPIALGKSNTTHSTGVQGNGNAEKRKHIAV